MAKATKRKSPAKRKPAARSASSSRWALSGWIVAAGLGAAWAGPQFGLWSNDVFDRIPSLDRLQQMASRGNDAPPKVETPHRVKAVVPLSIEDRAVESNPRKPVLPPIKPETISEIVRKAEAKPSVVMPKPQPKTPSSGTPSTLRPPAPVPETVPLVTAAIRKQDPVRPSTARPGDLAIRRYPFTTAPAVAYVGDLRTIRILGGEGDWKKVQVSATGVTGWIRLQQLGAATPVDMPRDRSADRSSAPIPTTALLRQAEGPR